MAKGYENRARALAQRRAGRQTGGQAGAKLYRFQPWLTVYGTAAATEVLQPCREWLDGVDYTTYHMQVQVLTVTNATLVIESATSREGPWNTATSFTGTTDTTIVLSSEGGGSNNFSRYIRWKLETSGTWEVCFQLLFTSGGGFSDLKLSPRVV